MHILTSTLFLISASTLFVQAVLVPATKSSDIGESQSANGISLKTGYEGYVAVNDRPEKSSGSDLPTKIAVYKSALIKATSLLLPFGLKIFAGVKFFSLVVLWGVIATSALCTYTPFCSFQMNLPNIPKQAIKDKIISVTHPYVSEESLNMALRMARTAFEHYDDFRDRF